MFVFSDALAASRKIKKNNALSLSLSTFSSPLFAHITAARQLEHFFSLCRDWTPPCRQTPNTIKTRGPNSSHNHCPHYTSTKTLTHARTRFFLKTPFPWHENVEHNSSQNPRGKHWLHSLFFSPDHFYCCSCYYSTAVSLYLSLSLPLSLTASNCCYKLAPFLSVSLSLFSLFLCQTISPSSSACLGYISQNQKL